MELDALTRSDDVDEVLDLAKRQLGKPKTPQTPAPTRPSLDEPTPVKTPMKTPLNEMDRLKEIIEEQRTHIQTLEMENQRLRQQLDRQGRHDTKTGAQLVEELDLDLPLEHKATLARILDQYV